MSSIKAFECLTGHISGLCTLSGKLTCFGSLSGKLSAVIDFNAYSGEYEVVPLLRRSPPETRKLQFLRVSTMAAVKWESTQLKKAS